MQHYQFFLFDWDGCLASTLQVWLETYKALFTEYGVSIAEEEISEHVFGDLTAPERYGVADSHEFMEKMYATMNQKFENIDLSLHAKDVLQKLHAAGKTLAIVSTSSKEGLEKALAHHGVADLFSVVLAKEDVTHHKPHPEVIEKAMDLLQADPKQTVIVGDSKKDIEAAKNAHIDSILYFPPDHKSFYDLDVLTSLHPTQIIEDFTELL